MVTPLRDDAFVGQAKRSMARSELRYFGFKKGEGELKYYIRRAAVLLDEFGPFAF